MKLHRALALLLPLLAAPASAIPLSVGVSSQVQVGWQASTRTAVRLTRVQDRGTGGIGIRPLDGSDSFAIYGTPFEPQPGADTFEYLSTLRDTNTVSETSTSTFSVVASQTTTRQTTNPAPLGFFQTGPSVFEQSTTFP